jgi:glycosyltransferase involved in cell wall biosynthesis
MASMVSRASESDLPARDVQISVVIATFERSDACGAAVTSALEQTLAPLEVIVCDDGSSDDTRARFEAWQRDDQRVRYLPLPHSGRPAPARNAGVRAARGEWVAFLDDDDIWRSGKLEQQAPHLSPGHVVAANAQRTSGAAYFPDLDAPLRPSREDILGANPIITSTAVASRERVLAAGGFLEATWARGVEDYALWLRLASSGAEFLVLPEVLVDYSDDASGRLSTAPVRREAAVARLAWTQWARDRSDRPALSAAVQHTRSAAIVAKDGAALAVKRFAGR